ncbi:cyclase family protein [Candidatus Poriferisocius sp.]|uniref:cyclase family protein n=1 Tax=Candidatus Poriferisocius sp. TaxID=3101276 RepID=UPI003B022AF4
MSSSSQSVSTAGLIDLVAQAVVYDLGRTLRNGVAQSPNHPQFHHCLDRAHGDRVRADGGSAAADLLTTGCHVGTHVDALAHVSHQGQLYGGVDAAEAQAGGSFAVLGIHELPPFVGRGVLLDVPGLLGVEICEGGHEITVAELESAVARQGTPIQPGDAVLVRSGWGAHFDDPERYLGTDTGVPGVGEAGARWLADQGAALAGADTLAFECLPAGQGHALLPAHRVLLVEEGINIIEALDLDRLAADEVYEFVFVLSHLNIYGATGAPVRPLALA